MTEKLTPEEIAELEAGSELMEQGFQKIKDGIRDFKAGLFGSGKKGQS